MSAVDQFLLFLAVVAGLFVMISYANSGSRRGRRGSRGGGMHGEGGWFDGGGDGGGGDGGD